MENTYLLAKMLALKRGLIGLFEEEKTPFAVWSGKIFATEGLEDNETEYITVKVRFNNGNSRKNSRLGNLVGNSCMMVVGPKMEEK